MSTITLAPQYEKINPQNPFEPVIPSLLYHQYRTYTALKTSDLVINAYNTGTGKTKAAWLHLRDLSNTNVLFIAPTNELIRQHVKDIKEFVVQHHLDFHVLEVNAAVLRALKIDDHTFKNGEHLHRLIKNPLEYAEQLQLDTSQYVPKPLILVVNPDIFYYGLYFSYTSKDRRNVFEAFLKSFDYIVIDEFHYYHIKQLANFLFFFIICQQFDYLDGTRKICLLSATPNEQVLMFLDRIGLRYSLIFPDNEPSESQTYSLTQSLGEVELNLSAVENLEELVRQETSLIHKYLLEDHLDGAIISSALWKINLIQQHLKDLPTGRITGAETRESRQSAQYKPLILATPTVDIGYNFEKHQKDRQNIDFLFFDGYFQDDFLQRVGRVARTLGKPVIDRLSYAYAVTEPEVLHEVTKRGQTRYERKEFAALIQAKLPPKHDLQAYVRSYALTEAFYPIYQLEKIMPQELENRLHQLFDKVKDVFTPTSKRTFGGIRSTIQTYETQKRILLEEDAKALRDYLPVYVREKTGNTPSSEQIEQLYTVITANRTFKDEVMDCVRQQYAVMHALFSFRDAFEGPTAFVYDPRHLLSDQDVTEYDLFHLIANFHYVVHDKNRFEELAQQKIKKTDFYLELKDFQIPRLFIGFRYEAGLSQEDFDRLYGNQLKALKGLKLTASLPGNVNIPLALDISSAIQEQFIPCLIVKPSDRGRLYLLLRKKSLYRRTLLVQVEDSGTEIEYPIVLGTAAFLVHAELYGYFCMKDKQASDCLIV
jgi:CRISPR-associated endonuclease/helicase Cas3